MHLNQREAAYFDFGVHHRIAPRWRTRTQPEPDEFVLAASM
jgi:hypothetical protein